MKSCGSLEAFTKIFIGLPYAALGATVGLLPFRCGERLFFVIMPEDVGMAIRFFCVRGPSMFHYGGRDLSVCFFNG